MRRALRHAFLEGPLKSRVRLRRTCRRPAVEAGPAPLLSSYLSRRPGSLVRGGLWGQRGGAGREYCTEYMPRRSDVLFGRGASEEHRAPAPSTKGPNTQHGVRADADAPVVVVGRCSRPNRAL